MSAEEVVAAVGRAEVVGHRGACAVGRHVARVELEVRLAEINAAIADVLAGKVVKPVLVW